MNNFKIKKVLSIMSIFFIIALLTTVTVSAQNYDNWPEERVRLVVPFSAGGLVDTFARGLQPYLSEELGVRVIVENMPGAGTRIGNEYVYNSDPDGYTILVANNAELSIGEIIHDVDYTTEGFTYIDTFFVEEPALIVSNDSPINTLEDLREMAQEEDVRFAHIGTAGYYHLQTLLIEDALGVEFRKAAYPGGAPIGADLQGGHVDVGIAGFGYGVQNEAAGNLKVIGVCGQSPHSDYPNIPSVGCVEPQFEGGPYVMGLMAPPEVPSEIRDKLENAYQSAINNDEFVEWAQNNAMFVNSMGHEEYKSFMINFKEHYMQYEDLLQGLME